MNKHWRRHGNCVRVDPELMFPGSLPEDIAKAKAVCKDCPVYRTCLRDIVRTEGARRPGAREGIVAALTGHERFLVYRTLKRRGQLA